MTAIVLFILFVVLCTYVRRPYETVLLVRFGKVIEDQDQTKLCRNWYFKSPTDSVVRIDNRLHLYTSGLSQANTAGNEPLAVRTYAAWRITNPRRFYTSTGGGSDARADSIIGQKMTGLAGSKLATHKLDEMFNVDQSKLKMAQIENEIAKEATDGKIDPDNPERSVSGLSQQGIEIVQVGFARMAFPPTNAQSVYDRMAAERNKQADFFRGLGDAEAARIVAEGQAEAAVIRANAQAEAEKIRGEGDRKALIVLGAAQQSANARDFYQYWKSMDFLKSSLQKNTYLVLPSNSDLLKNLFVAPALQGNAPTTQPQTGNEKH